MAFSNAVDYPMQWIILTGSKVHGTWPIINCKSPFHVSCMLLLNGVIPVIFRVPKAILVQKVMKEKSETLGKM